MNVKHWASAVAFAFTACAFIGTATAAPVWLQDYEAPGNLDAPFNLFPDHSGTTVGVNGATDANTHTPTDGAIGTAASTSLGIPHLASESPTAAGWQWQVRFLPNNGGSNTGATGVNPLFNADGYVGFYLKVDSTVTADIQVSPLLEGPGGTGESTGGVLQSVIKDGQWHRYQWNMDDPAQWPETFNTLFTGGLGNATLEATNSFDSIVIVSSNGGDATILIDQIGYDNAGELPSVVPEPASLSLAAMGLVSMIAAARRKS